MVWTHRIFLYNKAATPPPLHKWTVLALNPLFFFFTGSREKFYIVCHHITWGKYTECPFSIFLTPDLEFNRSCKVRVLVYLLAIFHNILRTITNIDYGLNKSKLKGSQTTFKKRLTLWKKTVQSINAHLTETYSFYFKYCIDIQPFCFVDILFTC